MKKISILTGLALILVILSQCGTPENKAVQKDPVKTDSATAPDGFALLENTCFFCHSPGSTRPNKAAPVLADIKKYYLEAFPDEPAFTAAITHYLANPADSLSKIPGAPQKYGLMPKLGHSPDQVKAIARYIYHTPIEKEGWYENEYPKEKEKWVQARKNQPILEKATGMASRTKAVLGMYLLTAIKEQGTAGAVSFCSTRALHITDSMGKELGATIQRVTDRNRNPANKAGDDALAYILQSRELQAKNSPLAASGKTTGNRFRAFIPIYTDKLCLQCHGEINVDIKPEVFTRIHTLYPGDQATGFRLNQLRGIWDIQFNQ